MKTMKKKKMNIVKHFAEAAVETTMPMSFGLVVTSVKGGIMGNV